MSNTQKIVLANSLCMTLLILALDNIYPGENMVQYVKYTVMFTLFLSATLIKKEFPEQKIMALSFFFVIIADFFLVVAPTLWNKNFAALGMMGFFSAYICLIAAYHKGFKVGGAERVSAIPIILIFLYVFLSIQPYLVGFMSIPAFFFGIVLCYMTWTAVCTVFRSYFTPKIAGLIALSASLMFICDIGVAFSLFHPLYSNISTIWPQNVVWIAYIQGWTLLVVVINEKDFINF